ncbi:MAG: thioredoxin-disulfide reductase [Candidatus Cloacimonetes bacterium HGW-Cloacimonetes-3]|jgi:thioredoxin reductase (NADPH)|nr:MAG: thioredoxin-disulfide reductase [Candidatus Cloacimonetes bacterium HGW-Cloacimonetes-3]
MLDFNLNLSATADPSELYDVIIIGGGPAGLTAGLYAARYKLKTLMMEKEMVPGGQLIATQWVENYPGFPEPVLGQKLAKDMEEQAKLFGLEIMREDVESVQLSGEIKEVKTPYNTWKAKTILIATGSSPRKLGLADEAKYAGNGVSYCATCDGPFYPDKVVAVVGGGNSAFEEALFIAKYARKLYLIHRSDSFTADSILQERVKAEPKIELIPNTVVESLAFAENPRHLMIKNIVSNKESKLTVDGIFIFIGSIPNTGLFDGQLELENGYIKSYPDNATSIEGVWVAGDVQEKKLRQVATAVGDGANAAHAINSYLLHRQA